MTLNFPMALDGSKLVESADMCGTRVDVGLAHDDTVVIRVSRGGVVQPLCVSVPDALLVVSKVSRVLARGLDYPTRQIQRR